MSTNKERLFQFILPIVGAVLFGSQIWRDANIITIDTLSKTITFSNFFTKKQRTFEFNSFDGFIDMVQSSKSGTYRVIYLVQDSRYVEKISSFYYSNLEELQNALTPTKYLGRQKYNIFKSIKVLFNKRILG